MSKLLVIIKNNSDVITKNITSKKIMSEIMRELITEIKKSPNYYDVKTVKILLADNIYYGEEWNPEMLTSVTGNLLETSTGIDTAIMIDGLIKNKYITNSVAASLFVEYLFPDDDVVEVEDLLGSSSAVALFYYFQ